MLLVINYVIIRNKHLKLPGRMCLISTMHLLTMHNITIIKRNKNAKSMATKPLSVKRLASLTATENNIHFFKKTE
jgi:hypothetical protein